MRTTLLALLLLASGCAAPKSGKITTMPRQDAVVAQDVTDQTRYPEVVMTYHVGRYADPNQPLLLHESHTVYRREGQAAWNLHSPPASLILPTGVRGATNSAFQQLPLNDAIAAELNRQRSVTRVVTHEAESLNGSLRDLAAALSSLRNLTQENQQLREQLLKANERLDTLEKEIKQHPPETPLKDDNQ